MTIIIVKMWLGILVMQIRKEKSIKRISDFLAPGYSFEQYHCVKCHDYVSFQVAAQLLLGLKKWKVKDILDLEYVDNISSFSKEPTPNNSPIALKANFMTYCADCDLKLMAKSLKHHMSYLPSL